MDKTGMQRVAAVGTAEHGGAWHGPGYVIEVTALEAAEMIKSGQWKAAPAAKPKKAKEPTKDPAA